MEDRKEKYGQHSRECFGGDQKVGTSILSRPENRLKQFLLPYVPGWLQTYHLTLATIIWSSANVVTAFFASAHPQLLWLVSLTILLQYITDLLDGEVGRQRDTGLITWGFYMDHFLDYLFLCSLVFVGFMVTPLAMKTWGFGLLVAVSGFMVNSFLAFGATNRFEIYHFGIGPTEMRLVFILVNTGVILFGASSLQLLLPSTVVVCLAGLLLQSYLLHKKLWHNDMQLKHGEKMTAAELATSACEDIN